VFREGTMRAVRFPSVLPVRFSRPLVSAAAAIAVIGGASAVGLGCNHASAAAPASSSSEAPFATPPLLAGTPDIATLVAKVKPGVVAITSIHEVRGIQLERGGPFGGFDPFGGMDPHGGAGGDAVEKQKALGSGFIIDHQGHVLTNAHVVEDATQVKVRLSDDREYDAKVKGRDERLDLAVLELQNAPADIPTVSLGQSEPMRVGEYVVAIGNPFGLGNTVTMGIVSAKSRAIGAGPYDDFIQTDAAINPGNSGGPLFDLRGQVIGINTAINPNGRGIGFAIPIDAAKDVLQQLITTGKVARGRIGVAIQPVDADLAHALGLPKSEGALVGDVEKGGPADRAGLVSGDVITAVDTTSVPHAQDLPRLVARHAPGSHVKLTVMHDKASKTVDVTLAQLQDTKQNGGDEDGDDPAAAGPMTPAASGGIGVQLATGRDGSAIVARVSSNGAAAEALKPGDVLVEVNHQAVTGPEDAAAKIRSAAPGDSLLFKILRQGQPRYAAVAKPSGGPARTP
jgi:serine protease Do